ncbi:hypothetical protein LMIY3S_01361 [Labrys miyagiensis]
MAVRIACAFLARQIRKLSASIIGRSCNRAAFISNDENRWPTLAHRIDKAAFPERQKHMIANERILHQVLIIPANPRKRLGCPSTIVAQALQKNELQLSYQISGHDTDASQIPGSPRANRHFRA